MDQLNLKQMREMTSEDINEEIIKTKRELLELRVQKATRQSLKPHLFKSAKNKLAKLLTIESEKKT
uniref:ribosomal protein L29 n=1 Tax=Erythrolobus coxiae TaxID=362235 RepID=UPI001FCD65F2|nr:ribosomal protein L29 [Erythrolobus coxiae]UNJ17741.1 ribosomal protein L29 [Erythrolobus coxiae]